MHSGLFLPASNQELRDFSSRLHLAAAHLSGNMPDWERVSMDTRIHHGDGSLGRIVFEHIVDSADKYTMSLSQLVPVDMSQDNDVANRLQDEYDPTREQTDEDEDEWYINEDVESLLEEYEETFEEEADDLGDFGVTPSEEPEGYIEHLTEIKLTRFNQITIAAMKSVYMNLLTPDFVELDAYFATSRFVVGLDEQDMAKDLEAMYNGEAPFVDFQSVEAGMSLITRADLIMFTNALIRMRLLGKNTIAFRGAKPYMDLPVLPLTQPSVGY